MDTFNVSGDQTTQEPATQAQEPTTTLSFKVGEREYDVDSASKKIAHADAYINELKAKEAEHQQRIADLEAKLAQSTKLDQALEQVKLQQTAQPQVKDTTAPEAKVDVAAEVTKVLEQREAQARQTAAEAANKAAFSEVAQALSNKFGAEHVDRVVQEKAAELGLDFATAISMASNPQTSKAFLKLMGVENRATNVAVPSGQINSGGFQQKQDKPSVLKMTSVQMAEYMKSLRN